MFSTLWLEYQNRTIGLTMANGWTPERRTRQAVLIHGWRPWEKAHGAVTPEGKKASSKNAHRFTQRKAMLFAGWILKQSEACKSGRPYAKPEEVERRFEDCHCKPW